ncbi:MAG: hypothetical protein HY735_14375 [Verrucomicrobia bacterium]|nr:hypothetical protein [Verrucomicrobiota bacterium]
MARNPKLEALLVARWEAEQCAPAEKPAKFEVVRRLAEAALIEAGRNPTGWRALVAATQSEYWVFRAERLKEQMRRLSRLR